MPEVISDTSPLQYLYQARRLDLLSLAAERPDAMAILDDALARRMARHLGVRFTGTLGVLLRAKAAGHLERVKPVVEQLQALGFRLRSKTRDAILDLADES